MAAFNEPMPNATPHRDIPCGAVGTSNKKLKKRTTLNGIVGLNYKVAKRHSCQHTGTDETKLGKNLPESDEDKFLGECATHNVMLEGCILRAAIKNDVTSVFTRQDDIVSRAKFADVDGDVFVVLKVIRTWVEKLRNSNGSISSWVENNGLEQVVLHNIEDTVQDVHSKFQRHHSRAPELNFRGNLAAMRNSLTDILIRTHKHELYVYSGYDALGYKNISNGRVIYLHPSSILNYYTNKPKFIIPLITNSNPSVAEIIDGGHTQRQVLMCHPAVSLHGSLVFAVPETIAMGVLTYDSKGGAEAISSNSTCLIIPNTGYATSTRLSQRWNDHVDGKPSVAERIISICGDDDFVVVDLDFNNCELRIFCVESVQFCDEPLQNAINELIMSEISEIRNELSNGTRVLPYPKHSSPSSLIIGQGLKSDYHLFPGESTTALVKSFPGITTTWSDVVSILDSYKDTAKYHKNPQTDIRRDVLGTIMMESPDALQKVVAESRSQSFPFRLSLQRDVNNSLYYFNDDLCLPLIWKVHTDSYTKLKVTPADVAHVRATLCRVLDDLPEDNVTVYVAPGSKIDHAGIVRAQILFTDHITAHRGLNIVSIFVSRGVPVQIENQTEVEDTLRSLTLTIKDELFNVVSNLLLAKLENFCLSDVYQAKYNLNFDTPRVVCLHLTTTTALACIEAMMRLEDTITPQTIKLSTRDVVHLGSLEGKVILHWLARDTETCIRMPSGTDELLVYGTRAARKSAEEVVLKHLSDIAELNYDNFQFIRPKEDGLPHDFVLRLATHLQQFYISPNLLLVHTMLMKSRAEVIADLKNEYRRQTRSKPEVEIPEPRDIHTQPCVSCYIDLGADDKYYILEGCGHVYCMECLYTQVTDAVATTSFPALCAHDNQPFCAADFINITDKLHIISRNRLMKATVRYFVKARPHSYKFCARPNCIGVVRIQKTSSKKDFLQCSTCSKRTCPKCFLVYHKFITCEEAGEMEFVLVDWLLENQVNRKICPYCKIGIEKNGGCNKVVCTCCRKHICWKCLEFYDTSGACYQHISRVHGGI